MTPRTSKTIGPHATLALAALVLLTGCRGPVTRDLSTPARIWPPAPAVPRIELEPPLVALRPPAGFFGAIGRFISGAPKVIAIDRPVGLSVVPGGRLAIVDQGANRVYVTDIDGDIAREIDLGRAGIEEAVDVAAAPDGSLYVSDPRRGRVVRFPRRRSAEPEEIPVGGRPTSLAWDARAEALVIVDTVTPGILVHEPGRAGARPWAPAVADGAPLNRPVWVAMNGEGGIWVVDALNFRVCHLDADGEFSACFGRGGDGPGNFSRPRGVAEDDRGHVYVVDALFGNCQIFDREGRLLLPFAERGSGPGALLLPSDIAIDGDTIFVADSYNRRIQVFRRLPPPAPGPTDSTGEETLR